MLWSTSCCIGKMEDTSNEVNDEYTYKNYYLPLSPDDEDTQVIPINDGQNDRKRRRRSQSLERFFEAPRAEKQKKKSSSVSLSRNNRNSYITTNTNDSTNASGDI